MDFGSVNLLLYPNKDSGIHTPQLTEGSWCFPAQSGICHVRLSPAFPIHNQMGQLTLQMAYPSPSCFCTRREETETCWCYSVTFPSSHPAEQASPASREGSQWDVLCSDSVA